MALYYKALEKTISNEGNYSDHPNDKGGETYKGISRIFNPDWEGWSIVDSEKHNANFPDCLQFDGDLERMVSDFYETNFWEPLHGEEIEDQDLANKLFDISVNTGLTDGIVILQHALMALNTNGELYPEIIMADGKFGPKTLAAIKSLEMRRETRYLIKAMGILQGYGYIMNAMHNINQTVFIRGWLNRISL
jgi:lysozyme family protein